MPSSCLTGTVVPTLKNRLLLTPVLIPSFMLVGQWLVMVAQHRQTLNSCLPALSGWWRWVFVTGDGCCT